MKVLFQRRFFLDDDLHNIKKYDAFIALGCVIKGETPHFGFISKSYVLFGGKI